MARAYKKRTNIRPPAPAANVTVATSSLPQEGVGGPTTPQSILNAPLTQGQGPAHTGVDEDQIQDVEEDEGPEAAPPEVVASAPEPEPAAQETATAEVPDQEPEDGEAAALKTMAWALDALSLNAEGWEIMATAPTNGRMVWLLVLLADGTPPQVLRGYHYRTRAWRGSATRWVDVERWVREFTTIEIEGTPVGWHADSFATLLGPMQ